MEKASVLNVLFRFLYNDRNNAAGVQYDYRIDTIEHLLQWLNADLILKCLNEVNGT